MWCILYWAGGFCGKAQILLYTRAHITSCFTLDKKTPPHIYPQIKHTKHGRLHLHFISSGAPYINLLQFCFVIAGNERVSNKKKRHHFYFYRFLPVSKKYLERRSSFRRAAVSVIYGLPFFSLSRSFFFSARLKPQILSPCNVAQGTGRAEHDVCPQSFRDIALRTGKRRRLMGLKSISSLGQKNDLRRNCAAHRLVGGALLQDRCILICTEISQYPDLLPSS